VSIRIKKGVYDAPHLSSDVDDKNGSNDVEVDHYMDVQGQERTRI
jgi:hypothetical protein